MITKVFSIFDAGACVFLQPFFARSSAEAVRALTPLVNSEGHNFCAYAADFTLFEIGSYDDVSGVITMYDVKNALCSLLQLQRSAAIKLPESASAQQSASE